jgi:hypothetical protein
MADSKLTELTATTVVFATDQLYLVQGGVSKRITLANLMNNLPSAIGQSSTTLTISGSSTVTSIGTAPSSAWLSFDTTTYDSVIVDLVAEDATSSANSCVGTFSLHHTSGSNFDSSNAVGSFGTNPIYITVVYSAGVLQLCTYRGSASTDNVKVRWSAKLFKV